MQSERRRFLLSTAALCTTGLVAGAGLAAGPIKPPPDPDDKEDKKDKPDEEVRPPKT